MGSSPPSSRVVTIAGLTQIGTNLNTQYNKAATKIQAA
jgi:Flp pilus assembly pilin Flp